MVVLHESALLAALVMFFEMLWAGSDPLPTQGPAPGRADRTETPDQDLLALLALGMKDETIARHLDVTVRTVTRRVGKVLDTLDARTRFQAGMRAVERGWLTPPPPPG